MGRPRIISSPEEFESRADAYFAECAEQDRPPLITGLALALGFANKQSLYDYEARDEYSVPVKRARTYVESVLEYRLHGANAAGAIFALKNFGWRDTQEVTHKGGVTIAATPLDESL